MEHFDIVHHIGTQNEATLSNGRKVHRLERIYVKEMRAMIPVASYDNHFIFETKMPHMVSFMCTCGGPAIIVGNFVYEKDASPEGAMFVCLTHAQTGRHADGAQ
jgi:hypothetical protein